MVINRGNAKEPPVSDLRKAALAYILVECQDADGNVSNFSHDKLYGLIEPERELRFDLYPGREKITAGELFPSSEEVRKSIYEGRIDEKTNYFISRLWWRGTAQREFDEDALIYLSELGNQLRV